MRIHKVLSFVIFIFRQSAASRTDQMLEMSLFSTPSCSSEYGPQHPNDGEKLFEALRQKDQEKNLVPLMTAYAQAPSKSRFCLKIQILSLYAYELPAHKLNGPGKEVEKTPNIIE